MLLYFSKKRIAVKANALLAQLDRVFGYEPKGQGFESLAARQKNAPNRVRSFMLSKRDSNKEGGAQRRKKTVRGTVFADAATSAARR